MPDPVSWDRVAAVLDDPDVSGQTKAALLDAYAVAKPGALRAHQEAYAAYGSADSATPNGTPIRYGPNLAGQLDSAPLAPELTGLGVATVDAPDVGRWVDTRDLLAQARLESASVGRLAGWEKKIKAGPDGVDTADELLAAGAGGLVFFRLFLPAYNRLATAPLVPTRLADYQQLYDAEKGLRFSTFVADADFLASLATSLSTGATDVATARDSLDDWGGNAGTAARAHLTALVDRVGDLATALADGDAPTALCGLLRKAVSTMQQAVLQKAQTVAALKSSTVFRSPALTPSEIQQLIDATEPGAPDDVLLDAATVMRAEQLPASTLLNPAVRIAIRSAAQTWTDGFLQWFAAVDRTFRTACSTAATAVEESLKTMADGYRVALPDAFFGGIPLLPIGDNPPGSTPPGTGEPPTVPPATPPIPADPAQLLAGRPPGTGWVAADDPLPPGWYLNPVTGEVGPLFPPDGRSDVDGQPEPRPPWLPPQYGYLPADLSLPDGWQLDATTGQLVAPPGFVAGAPAPVHIGSATGTVQPSSAFPGSFEVNLRDGDGVMHQHQVSYDANGDPVIGDDLDGVSQLADLSGLDDTSGGSSADIPTAGGGAGAGMDLGTFGGSADLSVPDVDLGTVSDASAAAEDDAEVRGLADTAAAPTVVQAPVSWSPDAPPTNLSASGGASLPPVAGAPITAAGAASGHGGPGGFIPMMPMMPTGGEPARPASRYAAPSAPSELIDEEELAEIETLGPVIGSKE